MKYGCNFAVLPIISLCAACQISPEYIAEKCPSPAPPAPIIEGSPRYPSDREALAEDKYFDLMIAHGNLSDLKSMLVRATAPENSSAVSSDNLARLRSAIKYREQASCPDTPSYDPYRHYTIVMPLP